MDTNTKLGNNSLRKVALLILEATRLGMDLGGEGAADENTTSGYVYLWLEAYPFTLVIPPGDFTFFQALWTSPEDGEEVIIEVGEKSLDDLLAWTQSQEEQHA